MRYALIVFFTILSTCFALSQDITFQNLTTENGLSQISVNDLYQDERGFIWIGTREGLNCYNGNDIQIYRMQKDNLNSLFSNNILKITGNKNGKIYFLCVDGISEWDMNKEQFRTILKLSNVSAIYFNKALYVAKNNQLYRFNKDKLSLYYELPEKDTDITSIFIDTRGILWVGTSNYGLYKIDHAVGKIVNPIPKANITNIYEDGDKDIWVGSWEHGVYRLVDGNVLRYLNNPKQNSISSNFARAFCQDNQGNIWIGTFTGLDKFDKKTGQFSHYSTDTDFSGMTHNSIWCIIKDHQGTIWFGTYFGGVNYFNPDYEIYTRYKTSKKQENGLSSPIVGKMTEDNHGNLWICTEGGGLNVYNRKTKTFKWYQHKVNENSISHNNVKFIYFDSENTTMWIGTHLGGLNKLDLKTNLFTHYRSIEGDSTSLPSDIIRDIVPYKNELIIATQNGICQFSPQTGKCRQLFKDTEQGRSIKMVADLFIDYYGTLWIAATGEGVFSYDFETKKLSHYQYKPSDPSSISNNNINNIYQDHYYNLWFSTSGSGLDLFNYESKKFTNFDSQKIGLASDCVYEVCESRYGKLLLITNQGFGQFDYSDSTFYNYNKENGFPMSAINENALYLTNDGEVFLGGVQGMVSFYEKDLQFTKMSYNIVPYRLTVNNKVVTIDDRTDILHTSLSSNPSISLDSEYSVFSIEFAITNYIPAIKDKIVYRLEGFSQDWINTNGQNIITYTNLNPGKYTLVIKAENAENIPEVCLDITVLPPFYKTIYAYLFYIIVITLISYFIIKSYNNKIKLQESLKYEQKHTEDIEQLNQSKLRFFTNISHELRTPLTLIIGQIEVLMNIEQFAPNVYNKLLSVYKSSLQMKELVTELLDFRKQEQGHVTIKVSKYNLVDFLQENYLLFLEYANTKGIKLVFDRKLDNLDVWFDSKQLQKVLSNLLSNAFKHTKPGDQVIISVRKEEEYAVFEIQDTGEGIPAKDLDKIFDRFYQIEDASSGTGIGLALSKGIIELHKGHITVQSKKGEGSIFSVYLRLGQEHFSYNEITEEILILENDELSDTLNVDIDSLKENTSLVKPTKETKILIVEDNDVLRNMLIDIFEPFYEVISASDGQEGLELVKKEKPDLILSDILMPKMSGVELCKEVKGDIETCHIPVVLLTAKAATKHTIEGLQNGADDYIIKPFNTNVLLSRCNNLVNSRIILQEKFGRQPQMTPMMLATNRLDKEMLDTVMEIVESNMNNPDFTIEQLADELCIARTSLYAKIKAITGQTPNKFILAIRLKKAAFLLRNNPELRISEISYMTGFTSSGYFGKCFKDIYHMTPLAYRSGIDGDE
jgi:signal transduction histidine kinase/ligand-binding sensor domain-containing protein/CheY-like chemotaxis protein/AraC-like DNA-binding protein